MSDTKYEDLFRDTYGHTLGSAMLPAIDAVATTAKADERRRVLDEIETFMDNGATGWQNLRDYIARMRQEAGQ